jgi:hypothetical protein
MTAWTDHIREFAKTHNMTYMCALSDPNCKATYQAKNPQKLTKKQKKEVAGMEAEEKHSKEVEKKHKEETETMQMSAAHSAAAPSAAPPAPVPKKKAGRPKKYASPEEAKKAKKIKTVESNRRKRQEKKEKKTEGQGLEKKIIKHFKKDNKELKELEKAFVEHKKVEHQVDSGKGLVVTPLPESSHLYPLSHDTLLKMLKHLL